MITNSKKIRIALTGGGSGGHVYPLIAVMEELQASIQQGADIEIHYFGAADEWGLEVINRGAISHKIAGGKWRKYFSLLNFLDLFKIAWSFIQAFWKLFWLMPDVIFSKGGPGAWPVVVAGWFYRIPVIVHESDAVPGLTNLLSAPFARRVAVGFESSTSYFNGRKVFWSGNPVRPSLLTKRMDQSAAKETLGFNSSAPLVLIGGGSQGAQSLNEIVLVSLKDLLPLAQVYHQTGSQNFAAFEMLVKTALLEISVEVAAQSRYKNVPYLDEEKSALALSAADVIVGRAGAGTIFEIAAFGKPAVLVPLDGHQKENAYAFRAAGAAKVIEGQNLTPPILIAAIKDTLENKEVAAKMSDASARFYKPDATQKIALEIIALAGS